jgi:hypothetical protein
MCEGVRECGRCLKELVAEACHEMACGNAGLDQQLHWGEQRRIVACHPHLLLPTGCHLALESR